MLKGLGILPQNGPDLVDEDCHPPELEEFLGKVAATAFGTSVVAPNCPLHAATTAKEAAATWCRDWASRDLCKNKYKYCCLECTFVQHLNVRLEPIVLVQNRAECLNTPLLRKHTVHNI